MLRSDLKWYGGIMLSAACAAAGLYFFPHAFHDYVWGATTFSSVFCARNITPAGSIKEAS